jgi:glucose/arabinose dehydrogenase
MPVRRSRALLLAAFLALAACSLTSDPASVPPTSFAPEPDGSLRGVRLVPVVDGLTEPVGVVGAPDGSRRLYVIEKAGIVRLIDHDGTLLSEPFLDITDRVGEMPASTVCWVWRSTRASGVTTVSS